MITITKTTTILDKLHFQNSFNFTRFSYNFYANPQFFKKFINLKYNFKIKFNSRLYNSGPSGLPLNNGLNTLFSIG